MLAEALKVGGVPLSGALLTLGVARVARPERRVLLVALGLAATSLVAHGLIAGWPKVPPTRALQVLGWLSLAAPMSAWGVARGRGLVTSVLVAAAVTWFLAGRLGVDDGGQLLGLVATGVLLCLLMTTVTAARATAVPGALAVVAGGTAGVALLNHSARLASLGGALAVALAVVALVTLWRPCRHVALGAAAAGSALLAAQLVYDLHYVEVPVEQLLLLAAGWATLLQGRLPGPSSWSEAKAMVCHAALAAGPVAAALILAYVRRSDGGGSLY